MTKIFSEIAKSDIKNYIREIVELVIENEISREKIQIVLSKYSIKGIQEIKTELLDVLIAYANYVLENSVISDVERRNFKFLKMYFKIKEGDFYQYKQSEIKQIINK